MDVRTAQAVAWENKQAKGFNTTDVAYEFGLLHGEIAEAFTAWRLGQPDLDDELADVAIYLFGLAEMNGIDLQSAIERKLQTNAARQYVPNPDTGVMHRVRD
ncbi:MazG-like family protein [Dactylosporangium sp. CS-047395]|uniref:MazG-like family protein n=1 Tax=Dactylosporangium sp. CS-047395 TaxID=3239936 RepID=UPI003D8E63AC